ncbi:unnamed protein product [Arabis nemorensis]|uniref:Uncharacterized protein n=1 Tax=Arabis nemorensis TaxID=586526 RepID=A0A565BKY5_9BRAS|nr:unnamed protein product [Arabis nemorensis]
MKQTSSHSDTCSSFKKFCLSAFSRLNLEHPQDLDLAATWNGADAFTVMGRVGFNFPVFLTLINYVVASILLAFNNSTIPKELVNHIKSDSSVLPRIGALREGHEVNPPKSLGEIHDFEEKGKAVALCEIVSVVSDMGWFYISCQTCQKKVVPIEKRRGK